MIEKNSYPYNLLYGALSNGRPLLACNERLVLYILFIKKKDLKINITQSSIKLSLSCDFYTSCKIKWMSLSGIIHPKFVSKLFRERKVGRKYFKR